METFGIRPFVPSLRYQETLDFYRALGFTVESVSDDLSLCSLGASAFYL